MDDCGGRSNYMNIVARFFPNGEFSHGVDSSRARKERRHRERRHELVTEECKEGYLQWIAEMKGNADIPLYTPGQAYEASDDRMWVYTHKEGENHYFDCYSPDGADVLGVQMNYPVGRLIGDGRWNPLVHQVVETSAQDQKPSRKRLEAMTSNMARNIRNAAYVLEVLYERHNLSFITVTLPNLSTNDLAVCCERWDEIVDNFLHSLRKRVKKHGDKFEYVYCTEIQPKRLEKRHEYAPHLHLVMRGRNGKKKPWYVSPKQVRSAWCNAIAYILGHDSFIRSAVENIQQVRKSAGGYISKYMSKGVRRDTVPDISPVSQLRTQWGGMARSISKRIRQYTRRLTSEGEEREFLLTALESMDLATREGYVAYYKRRFIVFPSSRAEGEERGIWVGCGRLQTSVLKGGLDKLKDFVLQVKPTV